jgi:CubicO group peptidase (beta-lactamase class C family)
MRRLGAIKERGRHIRQKGEGKMPLKKPDVNWPLPYSKPEEAGISSARLAQINQSMQKYIDRKMIPNAVTLVARQGKIVHYEAQGFLDFDSRKPAPKDTIFRLWSNSKPIAGVGTMICVEEGLLDLDDPISKFIPAFKNPVVKIGVILSKLTAKRPDTMLTPTVPAEREITVRDCLRNTTGLPTTRDAPIQYMNEYKGVLQETGLLSPPDKQPDSIRKMMESLAQLPLESHPGTHFIYQVGYPIIGIVIETVTGKSLEDFYQERIFKPLGMKDTSYYLAKNKLEQFPTCYMPVKKKGSWELAVMDRPETSEKFKGPKTYFEAGGGRGGVLTTAADYARFAQMLLNGGELDGVRVLSRKTIELMTSSHTGDIILPMTGPGFGFGMGVGVYKGGGVPILRSIGTYGWSGAAGTIYFADPKEKLIGICFTQVFTHRMMPDNNYQEEFERLVYQSLL